MAKQKKNIKEPYLWFWIWRRHLRGSVFLCSGLGQRTSASQGRSCECCVGTSSTRGECSTKDVQQGRSRPVRLFGQGPSGVACFYVLFCNPPLRVFVDVITVLLMGRNKAVAEMGGSVFPSPAPCHIACHTAPAHMSRFFFK